MRLVTALADLTEADWQQQVVDLAKRLGYRHYHTHDGVSHHAAMYACDAYYRNRKRKVNREYHRRKATA